MALPRRSAWANNRLPHSTGDDQERRCIGTFAAQPRYDPDRPKAGAALRFVTPST
jgi:hypothetical protein